MSTKSFVPACVVVVASLGADVSSASAQEVLRELETKQHGFGNSDRFGGTIAVTRDLDGDGVGDLVIGSPDRRDIARGRVDVYSGATGTALWSRDGDDVVDHFGHAVSGFEDFDGDGIPDVLVGAPYHDERRKNDAGRAYLLSGADGSLLLSFDGDAGDYVGYSVAEVGDVDGDGRSDFAFGAPRADGAAGDGGRVHVHSGATGLQLFVIDGTDEVQNLGLVVGRAGDHDGDGLDDLLIGSGGLGGQGVARGRAEIVSSATHATLVAVDGVAPDDFHLGTRCASGSDLDHDGVFDLLVGDPENSGRGRLTGLARVVSGATGTTIFEWTGDEPETFFGGTVAFVGDVNGDGTDDVMVSVSPAHQPGTAILYSGATGTSLYRFTSGATPNDGFGAALAGGIDFDGDGLQDVVIGAPRDSKKVSQAGRVWIYRGNDLFLQAKPTDPAVGESLALLTRAREGGVLALLAVTAVNGVPTWVQLDLGPTDDEGRRKVHGDVPPGLSGFEVAFQAVAVDSRDGVVESSTAIVTIR